LFVIVALQKHIGDFYGGGGWNYKKGKEEKEEKRGERGEGRERRRGRRRRGRRLDTIST